jgi:hypothetical protein
VPAAPGAIVAESVEGGIKLTWIEPIDAGICTVKRAMARGGPYAIVAKDVKGSSYTDKTIAAGKVNYYVVSASNALGESADAREVGICAGMPTAWKQQDIGNVVAGGWSKFDGEMFTVEGGGSNIGGTDDQLQFAYTVMDGDGAIMGRYVPQVSSQHLKFGLIMRENAAADSADVAYLIQRGGGGRGGWSTVLMARPTAGGNAAEVTVQPLETPTVTQGRLLQPCWLRLGRAGNVFTASFSIDGKEWTQIGTTTVALKGPLLVGIGACSRLVSPNASATTTVMMDNVSVTGWANPAEGK